MMQRNLPQCLKGFRNSYSFLTNCKLQYDKSYNTIKLCKFLFLSFKTVVPPKIWEIYVNSKILHFRWNTL